MVHNILLTWVHNYMKPQKQYQKDTKSNAVGKNMLPLTKKGKKVCFAILFIYKKKIFFPWLTI